MNTAGVASNALGEANKIIFLRAHFQQEPPEQAGIGQEFLGQAVQVKTQVKIQDAVGEDVVEIQLNAANLQVAGGQELDGGSNISQRKARDGGHVCGGV